MVNFGREKYNVNIKQGFINDAKNIKYDYISFWDVLEHVTDLQATLEKIDKFSKKNTYLIVNVPDIDSYAAKLMKFKWPFYLNVHLYYFKKKTLENIFNKFNFELVVNFPHWQYMELGYILDRASHYYSFFSKIKNIINFLKISKIAVPYNMGQTTFVFKKNDK
jgi:2-polyprenyl-3-methyl-5-hydroxy-6-metoxy-1,4-benzoquinol methylase